MKSKVSSGLKKPVLAIGILLLLLAVIGFEGVRRKDDRVPQKLAYRQPPDTPRAPRVKPARDGPRGNVSPPHAVADSQPDDLPASLVEESVPVENLKRETGAASRRLLSQIYFIRSLSVLKGRTGNQSQVEAIEMLQRAVTKVGASLPANATIMDHDGASTSQVSILLHAKPSTT
ncbi:MAG: hypothetical protein EOP88_00865 [Verrucomicrobiaceae bacterium]|nr:MAG: hypothetical protein EOP88_00865 [Verrucomicrobiaceae bacterium]